MIDTRIVDFAEKHRIAVISTLLADGAPHSATIHYASARPLEFFSSPKKRRENSLRSFNLQHSLEQPVSLLALVKKSGSNCKWKALSALLPKKKNRSMPGIYSWKNFLNLPSVNRMPNTQCYLLFLPGGAIPNFAPNLYKLSHQNLHNQPKL